MRPGLDHLVSNMSIGSLESSPTPAPPSRTPIVVNTSPGPDYAHIVNSTDVLVDISATHTTPGHVVYLHHFQVSKIPVKHNATVHLSHPHIFGRR